MPEPAHSHARQRRKIAALVARLKASKDKKNKRLRSQVNAVYVPTMGLTAIERLYWGALAPIIRIIPGTGPVTFTFSARYQSYIGWNTSYYIDGINGTTCRTTWGPFEP